MIADTGREISHRRRVAHRRRLERDNTRQLMSAIDSLLNHIEERHLDGDRTFDRVLRGRLVRLEQKVGLPLPRNAIRARNTVRLHAALLDWQEVLLDTLLPTRLTFADIHDSNWAIPMVVGWDNLATT